MQTWTYALRERLTHLLQKIHCKETLVSGWSVAANLRYFGALLVSLICSATTSKLPYCESIYHYGSLQQRRYHRHLY